MAPFAKNMAGVRRLDEVKTGTENDLYTLEAQVDTDYLVAVVPQGGTFILTSF
jgi:hypothetical protein